MAVVLMKLSPFMDIRLQTSWARVRVTAVQSLRYGLACK